ncbi:MAG TPA: RNA methyltransferase [Solirubrobacteraceae bacterium]|jgi:TrmH family RNA methyltransferase|nr:RNA methyltransferase [Solirubrobacteraceae bacterium]
MQPPADAHPDASSTPALKGIFRDARRDPTLAVLEGLHALKHALRFGAEVLSVAIAEPERVRELAEALAPDVLEWILADAHAVPPELFAALAPQAPSTGVIAIARRPRVEVEDLLADPRPAPIVLLERPRDLGNLGACVRVAAAADIAGVLSTGVHDPWDPAALRGSAGLHYALPVARLGEDALPRLGVGRPLVGLDPDGEELRSAELPDRAILAFGGERHGLSEELRTRADVLVRLPMREGVSSLNLATSVSAVLYCWRLGGVG